MGAVTREAAPPPPPASPPSSAAAAEEQILPLGKHAFLSYQWDIQPAVVEVKDLLTTKGVKCWMDIDGGMKSDIYDSMAEGVQGAACVVCFMTKAYQSSGNCKLELKFAQQSGVPIIPVRSHSLSSSHPNHRYQPVQSGVPIIPARSLGFRRRVFLAG
jgi:hypothetical protein